MAEPGGAEVPGLDLGAGALAGWLAAEGVTQVVLEATGQQLEAGLVGAGEAGLELLLVNARHDQDPARPQDRRG